MRMHQYTDDCQIYVSISVANADATRLSACILHGNRLISASRLRLNRLISASRLRLNLVKTQIMWQVNNIFIVTITFQSVILHGISGSRSTSVAAEKHVFAICRSCKYPLWRLRPIINLLSPNASKTQVHAFISSRLDYCNLLLHGITNGLLQKLHSVQNAAARHVLSREQGYAVHITSVLQALKLLPV